VVSTQSTTRYKTSIFFFFFFLLIYLFINRWYISITTFSVALNGKLVVLLKD
jgi:hypothetical protein